MEHPRTEIVHTCGASNEYLPVYYWDLTPSLKRQAKEELFEDIDTTKAALSKFKSLIRGGNYANFPAEDEDLMPFLRARKHDVEKAYTMYKKYISQFSSYDDLYKDFDFSSVLKMLQYNFMFILPNRHPDGAFVGIGLSQKWNASEFGATEILRTAVIVIMDLLRCPVTQISGIKFIADCSGLSLNMLSTIRPWHIKFMAEFVQRSTPLRFKGCHFFNEGRLLHFLWSMLAPLLSKKVKKRVYFHGSDLKSLHKYFSPDQLPEIFGGNIEPLDNTDLIRTITQSKELITAKVNRFRSK